MAKTSSKSPLKITDSDLKLARKAGFKRSKPKKPKGTLTEAKYSAYVDKYNAWGKEVKSAAAEGKKIETAKDKIQRMKSTLGAL